MKLIFASQNKNKVLEVKSLMPPSVELLSLSDINFNDDIEETEATIEGNALLKARTIYTKTGMNCFADDSGLLIDALNGSPGVYSARYAGEPKNDEANLQKVLHQLSGIENRKAHFKTVMALIIDGKEFLCEGIINGTIINEKKGTNGFGYDPIFEPDGYSKTFAELDFQEKSTISHRALALQKIIIILNNLD
jgi:XTP/dITP diphosphohydrolase